MQMLEPKDQSGLLADIVAVHARASVLKYLSIASAYTLNDDVLSDLLDHEGLRLSRLDLARVLEWLRDQKLIKIELRERTLAVLLRAGADVAEDRMQMMGVARPLPQ